MGLVEGMSSGFRSESSREKCTIAKFWLVLWKDF